MTKRTAQLIREGIEAANHAAAAPQHPLARRAYRVRLIQLIVREAPQRRIATARQYTRHQYA